jgi:hypothetical protein
MLCLHFACQNAWFASLLCGLKPSGRSRFEDKQLFLNNYAFGTSSDEAQIEWAF